MEGEEEDTYDMLRKLVQMQRMAGQGQPGAGPAIATVRSGCGGPVRLQVVSLWVLGARRQQGVLALAAGAAMPPCLAPNPGCPCARAGPCRCQRCTTAAAA